MYFNALHWKSLHTAHFISALYNAATVKIARPYNTQHKRTEENSIHSSYRLLIFITFPQQHFLFFKVKSNTVKCFPSVFAFGRVPPCFSLPAVCFCEITRAAIYGYAEFPVFVYACDFRAHGEGAGRIAWHAIRIHASCFLVGVCGT